MNRISNIVVILSLITLISCNETQTNTNNNIRVSGVKEADNYTEYGQICIQGLKFVVIDSCEYLIGDCGREKLFTHKGNCKNCLNQKNDYKRQQNSIR